MTTLLDPLAYPAEELAALYGRRWRLDKPRRRFEEVAHRNRYWKNNPRKTKDLD